MHNPFSDFFQVADTDFNSRRFVLVVSDQDNYHVLTKNPAMLAQWETGNKSGTQTDMFCRDDELVFQLAHVAFKGSPGECHLAPKGAKHHSGHQAFFACMGQFFGIYRA